MQKELMSWPALYAQFISGVASNKGVSAPLGHGHPVDAADLARDSGVPAAWVKQPQRAGAGAECSFVREANCSGAGGVG